jgi:ketosteroid isomerase-like protein
LFLISAAVWITAACSNGEGISAEGQDAERFFDAWVEAWSSGDPYATARFYSHDVSFSLAQPDLELANPATFWDTTTQGHGRAWLAAWLLPQTIHTRAIGDVFIDSENAVVTITIDELATSAWVQMRMGDADITEQATLRWRDAHKPSGAPDARLAWVDTLVGDYIAAWSTGDTMALEELYVEDATVDDAMADPVSGQAAIAAARRLDLSAASLATIAPGQRSGSAVYVVPRIETEAVAIVVDAEVDGCQARTAILLNLEGRRITSERRLPALETLRTCFAGRLGMEGWWTDLQIPASLDEQVTSMVVGANGSEISIINGSPQLEQLLAWGLGRFSAAGLSPPTVESVSFAPVPRCAGLAGVVLENDAGAPDLVLCTDAYSACVPEFLTCTEFERSARFGLLHELAHVWLVENLDEEKQVSFMEATGAVTWRDEEVPWHMRGAERAAETMAWGLMDEPVQIIRLESPPCEIAAAGFGLLTGEQPLVECGP